MSDDETTIKAQRIELHAKHAAWGLMSIAGKLESAALSAIHPSQPQSRQAFLEMAALAYDSVTNELNRHTRDFVASEKPKP